MYANLSASVPLPLTYPAVLASPPIDSSSDGAGPEYSTGRLNSTSIAMDEPAACVPFAVGEETPVTDAGERRISWTPWDHLEATAAYQSPPISNASTVLGVLSASNPPMLLIACPAGEMVSSALMRASCTVCSRDATTMAYVLPPISNVSMPRAPSRFSKPGSPSATDAAAERVPSGLMRISWIPWSLSPGLPSVPVAVAMYVLPPDSNTAMPRGPSSVSKPPMLSIAVALACIVPSGIMRTTWTRLEDHADTAAYVPPSRSNTAMSSTPPSPLGKSADSLAESLAERAPPAPTLISCMPLSASLATASSVLPAISNASTAAAPSSSSNVPPSTAEPLAIRVPPGRMRISWMPLEPFEATAAYVTPPALNVSTPAGFLRETKSFTPFFAESAADMVPFSCMRTSWIPWLSRAVTRAYMSPPVSNTERR